MGATATLRTCVMYCIQLKSLQMGSELFISSWWRPVIENRPLPGHTKSFVSSTPV
jgi:hypothetical protein